MLYPLSHGRDTDGSVLGMERGEGPEIVVNGEVVGYGAEGMLAALFAMVPQLKPEGAENDETPPERGPLT